MSLGEPARRLWGSRTFRRAFFGLLALVIIFLWWNAVRRGMAGRSSQIDNFLRFGRDLFVERVNVYEVYEPSYTITKYPPFFGVLFLPLVFLPPTIAVSLWFGLNLALSVVAAWIAVRVVAERPDAATRIRPKFWLPYVMTAPVVISNLETGQVNILIITLLYGALFLYTRERDWRGGFVLGMATALKLTSGLFIPYFFLKREWRVIAGSAVGMLIAWVAVPVTLLGWTAYLDVHGAWLEKVAPFLADGTYAEGVGGFRHTNQSLSAALQRMLARTPAGAGREEFYVNLVSLSPATVNTLVRLVGLGILVGLAWLCRVRSEDRHGPAFGLECALVMIAALLLSPISWINHYVVLLFPYVVAVHYIRTRPRTLPDRRFMVIAAGTSALLLLTSVSVFLQAFSLPFLGAVALAVGLVVALSRERAKGTGSGSHQPPVGRGVVVHLPIRETPAP
ncbi:MAG: glycosyltransferase family 87 protein [Gemmatimonadota bacterium]